MTRLTLSLILVLLVGCANEPTYIIDHERSKDFSTLQTYRWWDDDHPTKQAEYRSYNASDKRMRTYMNRELKSKGFKEATYGQRPDFWIQYNVSTESRMRATDISGYYGSSGMYGGASVSNYGTSVGIGYSTGSSVREYKEGTLILDIVDVTSKAVIWRGIAEARLPQSMDQGERNALVSKVSREILAEFPPGA